jgi:hypothetical protein
MHGYKIMTGDCKLMKMYGIAGKEAAVLLHPPILCNFELDLWPRERSMLAVMGLLLGILSELGLVTYFELKSPYPIMIF